MSRARSEHPVIMLFHLPVFDDPTIYAALKGQIGVET
jgi:hypothetical protein